MANSSKQLTPSPTIATLNEMEDKAFAQYEARALNSVADAILSQKVTEALQRNPALLKEFNAHYQQILANKRNFYYPGVQQEARNEATRLAFKKDLDRLTAEAIAEAKEQIRQEILNKNGKRDQYNGTLKQVVRTGAIISDASPRFKYAKQLYENPLDGQEQKLNFDDLCAIIEDKFILARAIFNNIADSVTMMGKMIDDSKSSLKNARKEALYVEELLKDVAKIKQLKLTLSNPLHADEQKLNSEQKYPLIIKRFKEVIALLAQMGQVRKPIAVLAEALIKEFNAEIVKVVNEQNAQKADEQYLEGIQLVGELPSPDEYSDEQGFFKAMSKRLQSAIEKLRAAKNLNKDHPIAEHAMEGANKHLEELKISHELYVQAERLMQNPLDEKEKKLDVVSAYRLIVQRMIEADAKFKEAARLGYVPAVEILQSKEVDIALLQLREEIYTKAHNLFSKKMNSLEKEIEQVQKVIALFELCNKLDPKHADDELEKLKKLSEFLQEGKKLEDLQIKLDQGSTDVQQSFNVQLGIVTRMASRLGLYRSETLENLSEILNKSLVESLKKAEAQNPVGASSSIGLLSPTGSPVNEEGVSMGLGNVGLNVRQLSEPPTPFGSPTKA